MILDVCYSPVKSSIVIGQRCAYALRRVIRESALVRSVLGFSQHRITWHDAVAPTHSRSAIDGASAWAQADLTTEKKGIMNAIPMYDVYEAVD